MDRFLLFKITEIRRYVTNGLDNRIENRRRRVFHAFYHDIVLACLQLIYPEDNGRMSQMFDKSFCDRCARFYALIIYL